MYMVLLHKHTFLVKMYLFSTASIPSASGVGFDFHSWPMLGRSEHPGYLVSKDF